MLLEYRISLNRSRGLYFTNDFHLNETMQGYYSRKYSISYYITVAFIAAVSYTLRPIKQGNKVKSQVAPSLELKNGNLYVDNVKPGKFVN